MSTGSDAVRVERDGRVVAVTLDRPADRNRLTRDVLLALESVIDRLGAARRASRAGSDEHGRRSARRRSSRGWAPPTEARL